MRPWTFAPFHPALPSFRHFPIYCTAPSNPHWHRILDCSVLLFIFILTCATHWIVFSVFAPMLIVWPPVYRKNKILILFFFLNFVIQASIPQVGYPLGHPRNAGNDVAMGDHDALWYSRGSAGVHDNGDVGRPWWPALTCCCNVNGDDRDQPCTWASP